MAMIKIKNSSIPALQAVLAMKLVEGIVEHSWSFLKGRVVDEYATILAREEMSKKNVFARIFRIGYGEVHRKSRKDALEEVSHLFQDWLDLGDEFPQRLKSIIRQCDESYKERETSQQFGFYDKERFDLGEQCRDKILDNLVQILWSSFTKVPESLFMTQAEFARIINWNPSYGFDYVVLAKALEKPFRHWRSLLNINPHMRDIQERIMNKIQKEKPEDMASVLAEIEVL